MGTSAPPTGSTNSTPTSSDTATVAVASAPAGPPAPPTAYTTAANPTATAASPPNTYGPPGKVTGRPVISSCSFTNVSADPLNDTEPTTSVNSAATSGTPRSRPPSSSSATTAAAPPPTPLNSATSCGIAVIGTRRAAGTPTAAPTTIAATMAARFRGCSEANATATPSTTSSGVSAWPVTMMAPTRMTPWMAFAPDISGVCRVVDTLEITSYPVN